MKKLFMVSAAIIFSLTLLSQETDTSMISQEADTSMAKYRKDALKVFLDCPFCDDDYVRRVSDTLAYVSMTDNTRDETRAGQVETLKMGLIPFVSKTPLSKFIKINYKPPVKEEMVEDKWNQWVFRTRLSGSLNGQKSYKYDRVSGSFSAGRVTPEWKIDFDLYMMNSIQVMK